MDTAASPTFSTMIAALRQNLMASTNRTEEASLPLIQTHASVVLLAPPLVYKLKKPLNFGFFDYSTAMLRRHYCIQEVQLNRRLAPTIYLGVAPVLRSREGAIQLGDTFSPDTIPASGTWLQHLEVIDFAVVMRYLPDTATLEGRLRAQTISTAHIQAVARRLAQFHMSTATSPSITKFGSLDIIRQNWEENFAQMQPYLHRTLDPATYDHITRFIRAFLQKRAALFATRQKDGWIRDCHGDVRLPHIYILDHGTHLSVQQPDIVLLDCIEFNERFRYCDVASEVAFLAMELDAAGRADLSHNFVESYIAETGDATLREVLPFYACYRACVRGKVFSFQLDEREIPEEQRKNARTTAADFFHLAQVYADGPLTPTVIMIGGLMGTGKSTLAMFLQQELGWSLFSSDVTRKHLAHVDEHQPQPDRFGEGLYSAQWTQRTYEALRSATTETLSRGLSVLLDATFLRRADRRSIVQTAHAGGAQVIFVECRCDHEVILNRLAHRWSQHQENKPGKDASQASDGRPDLYEQQQKAWEAFDATMETGCHHLLIGMDQPLAIALEHILMVLHSPRLLCPFPLQEIQK